MMVPCKLRRRLRQAIAVHDMGRSIVRLDVVGFIVAAGELWRA
jgi:hypothetical protein